MEFIGLLLPIIIDLINRKISSADARFWISVGVCAVIGVGLNWIDTQFLFVSARVAFDSITTTIMMTFGLAQLSYNAVWKDMPMRDKLGLNAKKQ